ncbi:PRC-barrel domain-containing protein [Oscillochloris sp. ZM17-4]|uniref:PRC-barrel domain-containing protein n=1 Tax=Oscillochloris sp. ZM17-4 TaxID=2866714 RepID=UPI001C730CB8|nr:PRC-barrel domain-containing protein [Oscillochloris sp. ZM17-4]MBX0328866.1 PRC-barrel domain-containing protein [Oscillochloris sp. ZM17-4]
MLRSINDLRGLIIQATDGDIGHVDAFFFDDVAWSIRYMVANTGGWLLPETVLISPRSIRSVDWEQRLVAVNLTRQQVKDAPSTDTDEPVSRQMEIAHAAYYRYDPYWYGPGLWGGMGMAAALVAALRSYQILQYRRRNAVTRPCPARTRAG